MILTDKDIKEAVKKGEIKILNFDEKCLEPATYDMRIGHQGATTTSKGIINIAEKGTMIIEPGDQGVVITHEG
ncbi:MAG: hypothetical protein AB1546_16085, partial [bacterium]